MKKPASFLLTLILLLVLALSAAAAGTEAVTGYQAKQRSWQYVRFGAYPTDADGTVRPITWRVLSVRDQKAYLLSEYILFAHRVDPNCYPINKDSAPYAGWESSELFGYLNDTFLPAAFSPAEQTLLAVQEDGGLVSLPSIDDIKNEKYGFVSAKLRQAQSTEYAKANGLYVYQGGKKYSPYWSRTPSESKKYAHRRVMDDGKLGYISVEVQNLGVRPAVLLDLTKVQALSGSGTLEDPFIFEAAAAPAGETETAELVPDTTTIPEEALSEAEAPEEDAAAEAEAPEGSGTPAVSEVPDSPVRLESAYADRFPALTAEGFLPEGEPEFILTDEENGLWLYASQDLRVEIVRREAQPSKNRPWRWYEADIWTRPGSDEFLRVFYHENDVKARKPVQIISIARENRLVFAMNSDWYYYREQRNAKKKVMPVGIILRQGEVIYDDPAKKLWTTIPNRDILALYANGLVEVYDYNGVTAEELKQKDANDVLSFGPVLLSGGEITAQTLDISARQKDNPRSGVGMVEPGHYVSIVMEGRRSKISTGCSVKEFAELFQAKGCSVAYNLDGGGTASMMFMGEYINQMGNFTADARKQLEVLGIGISEQVAQ